MKKRLLVVEDDPGLQSQLRWCFTDTEVEVADEFDVAIEVINRLKPQVVTLDLGLPPDAGGVSQGFRVLEEILRIAPMTKVIIITGQEDREHALRAVQMGAYDFFNKPVDSATLSLVTERAFHLYQLELENRQLQHNLPSSPLDGLITTSPKMLRICQTLEKVAPSDLNVLLLGESGTGKEILANALHRLSPWADKNFVAINCAAIPENLLESELFGHEKGSFTGADKQKLGKVEMAHGGTLFLDEIGDMPFQLQAKMLRFLQERVIERIGGRKTIPVETRVVCATHRDLNGMIEREEFRGDLFFRISDIVLDIPPVRDRGSDAIVLAHAFLDKFSKHNDRVFNGFTAAAEQAIKDYSWPGNVRELEKSIKRAAIMAEGNKIDAPDLFADQIPSQLDTLTDSDTRSSNSNNDKSQPYDLRTIRTTAEIKAIKRALAKAKGNVTQAAKLLKITRPTLYAMIEKLGIEL